MQKVYAWGEISNIKILKAASCDGSGAERRKESYCLSLLSKLLECLGILCPDLCIMIKSL